MNALTILCLLFSAVNFAAAESFVELAAASGLFNFLNRTIEAFNVPTLLAALPGNVTIFGPNDEAFANIGLTNVSEIPEDLIDTLTNHVVLGDITLEYLMGVDCVELDTLGDQKIKVSKIGDMIMINEAQVLGSLTEFQGEDGTFHGIDAVIANGTFIPCPSEAPTAAPAAPETYGERAAGFVFGVTTAMVATIGTLVACVLSL